MSKLDPQLRGYFEEMAALFPPLPPDATPFARRARYWTICALGRTSLPSNVTMNDVELDLPTTNAGESKTRVRLFYGHDGRDEPVPTIIYFHGGGWVIGDIETHTATCARMAHEANALVASVEYPLAPEADWRAITDACFHAAVAIANDRNQLESGSPIALAGDSAGAHLATVTALRVRDENAFHVALQALIYPCTEPLFETASYNEFAMGPGLTKADMQWYWRHFAADALHNGDHRIAPTRAASLAGSPPAYLVTAGCDPLRDDGRAYVTALRAHDVNAAHDEFESMPHGFLRMTKYSEATNAAVAHVNRRIGELLRNSRT
jgi:acetyl esterase